MPISRPFWSIAPAPPQNGWAGAVAGKFLLANDHRANGPGSSARGDRHRIAELRFPRSPELDRWTIERAQRLHQAEAALTVDCERVPRSDAPIRVGEPDALGLHDQIADRQHNTALANDDAAAGPLFTQRLCSESVLGNRGLHSDDGFERAIHIDARASVRKAGLRFVAPPFLDHGRYPFGSEAILKMLVRACASCNSRH
jgi:hypothetical protein